MTTFFLGGSEPADQDPQAGYDAVRERSRVALGCPARPRRIFRLDCRLDGEDQAIEVGQPMPSGEGVVAVILDHGRERDYAVHSDSRDPDVVCVGRPVYAVTEFV